VVIAELYERVSTGIRIFGSIPIAYSRYVPWVFFIDEDGRVLLRVWAHYYSAFDLMRLVDELHLFVDRRPSETKGQLTRAVPGAFPDLEHPFRSALQTIAVLIGGSVVLFLVFLVFIVVWAAIVRLAHGHG
jgi:hypothetical protein